MGLMIRLASACLVHKLRTHMRAQNQSVKMETAESAKLKPVMLLWGLQWPPTILFGFQFILI